MVNKKINIAELEKQCLEAEKISKTLREQFEAAKKEEEEAKKVKLEAEKQKRYDAVVDAYNKFETLRTKFVDDYGSFTFKTQSKNFDWFWKTIGMM